MKKWFLAAAAMIALSATSAQAADVIEEAVFDWTGLYAGLNAGYAFGGNDDVGYLPGANAGSLEINGMFGGAQVGYNYQVDNIVMGVEGDFQFSGISDEDSNGGYDSSNDNNYFGTLRARAGFAADRALFYVTGGLAYGGFDYEVNAPVGPDISEDYSTWGYTVGGGVEYAFDESWSMKLEYLYANFGEEQLDNGGFETHATPDFHSVRVGVNFRF
jgi:outer membrane immunogenic protein